MATDSQRIVVIGAGPGGYAAAFRAADLGMDVTIVDPEANPGGVCLYRGCIPSKSLLHVAKVLEESRAAAEFGVAFDEPGIDLEKLRGWKEQVVGKLTSGLGSLAKSRKVRHIHGRAIFRDRKGLIIDVNGTAETLDFDTAIIATGARPARVPAFDIDSERVMDSTDALALADIPSRLLVVGGGYIGMELAVVYASLGTRVTVVEMLPQLLSGADRDLVKFLTKRLEPRMEEILLETRVTEMKETKRGIHVQLEGKHIESQERIFDKVLVSVGRVPNTGELGLSNTLVEVDDKGFIVTDDQQRTAEPNIFAIGDAAGGPLLAHKATHEGHVAAEVIAGRRVRFAPRTIPAVVFTDPEIAWCGLTEDEARAQDVTFESAAFPWAASGRATSMGRNDGLTKILFDPDTRVILGMGIAGVGAGELIGEGVLAVEMGALADDIALSIHPHPTMTESVMEAAELFLGHSDHYYRPRRK